MTPKDFQNFMNGIINEMGLTNRNNNLRKSNKGPNRVRKQLFKNKNNKNRRNVAAK